LFRGNLDSQAPFIIQIPKRTSYADKRIWSHDQGADEMFPRRSRVHLDHGDLRTLDCIESGSTRLDDRPSHEPLEENIRITRQVVDAAHARGISVEA